MILCVSVEASAMVNSEDKACFIQRLEQGEEIDIVCLGTSLTGGKWPWVDVLEEWLDQAYPEQVSLENMGVGASASMTVPSMDGNPYIWKKCGLDLIPKAISLKPDVVFIEFAVNDAYVPYNISLDQSRRNLESMISSLKEANSEVEIILQTMNVILDIPELGLAEASERPDLAKFNRMYCKVARKHKLMLIDHYSKWMAYLRKEGRDEYLKMVTDGVHPNLEAYRRIILPNLKNELQGNRRKK